MRVIPEIAAAYVIGVIPSLAIGVGILTSSSRKSKSQKTKLLQANLAKLGLYWSDYRGELRKLSLESLDRDKRLSSRGSKVLIISSAFLSWIGFLFLSLIYISMNYLAVPRTEKKLYSSELARVDLPEDEVLTALMNMDIDPKKIH